ISTSAFGTDSVRSRSRVPRPPQRIATGGSTREESMDSPVLGRSPGRVAKGGQGGGASAGGGGREAEQPPGYSAPRHGRQDRHLVAVGDPGLEPVLEADVLAGDIDVDETAQVTVLGDPLTKAV